MDAKAKFAAWDKPVALVGMMGAGKSYIGQKLARRFGVSFFDADKEIEQAANLSIEEIFERHGEAHFRKGEYNVIARLLAAPASIIATGGGAFIAANTRKMIQSQAISVWLNAAPELLYERLTKSTTLRPLLAKLDTNDKAGLMKRVDELLAKRKALYALADITINFSDDTLNAILTQIETGLMTHANR